jgi:hypothetical protein
LEILASFTDFASFADFARVTDFARLTDLARLTDFARLADLASFAVLAMRIAVTILPAGAAGDVAAEIGAFGAEGLVVEDLMIDFFETAMIVTSRMN